MMAVSELASSHSSGKDKNLSAATRAFGRSQSQFHSSNPSGSVFDDSFGKPKPVVKAINVVVLFSMLLSSLSAPLSAYAQIRSDANAPGNQRPTILNTANGLPQVNIQTPSAAGVSRNQYSQFDVDGRGVVINNSRTNTNTQLGGMVQGNPWLAQGSARIIVNEVNSSNPSYLNGYIEVAGQRAEIIIANPSGISVNGGGFINASSATLTTGSPIINGGNLEGYAVQKGTVTIDGYGLDASLTDYTGILARSVQVNAGIWANNLNIVTGANQISADQGSSTPIAGVGGAPSFSLDVSNLGGMYAGKISLVGTETGLGVRNAGYVGASAGDVSITSDGMLVNSGIINSGANTNIATKGSVNNSGSINATGDANIDSQTEMVNTGSVLAAGNINIQTPGVINNSGQVYASGNTSLKAGGDIHNSGLLAAQGNTSVTTTATNGVINNTNTSVLTAGMTPDGKLLTTGNLSLDADGLVTAKGLMIAGNLLSISSSSLDVSGTSLSAGALALTAKRGDLDATGASLTVSGDIDLKAAQTLKTDAAVVSGGTASINAGAWSNAQGQILQSGSADTTIAVLGNIDNSQGSIASNGLNMHISAASIDSRQGIIMHAGIGNMKLTADTLILTEGMVASNGGMTINTNHIDGSNSSLSSQSDMHINVTGDANFFNGYVGSGGSLALSAGSLNSSQGQMRSQGDLNFQADGGIKNELGWITSGANMNINSGTLDNTYGHIQSNGNMVIDTNSQSLINEGDHLGTIIKGILSHGTLTLTAGDIDNKGGNIASVGKANITGSSINNSYTSTYDSGIIISDDDLAISTTVGGLNNQLGSIKTGKNLSLDIKSDLKNVQGYILSNQEANITANHVDNSYGYAGGQHFVGISANTVKIITTDLDNYQGAIAATDTLHIQNSGTVNNAGGILSSTGDLVIKDTQASAADNVLGKTQQVINDWGGLIAAKKTLTIDSKSLTGNGLILNSGVELNGDITQGDINIKLLDNFAQKVSTETDGAIQANGNLSFITKGDVDNAGLLQSARVLNIQANNINNQSSGEISAGSTQLAANTITNRGLIDGSFTLLQANEINNIGTGRIYGDQVSILAGGLNNLAEGSGTNRKSAVIAARERLDIGASVITNQDGALMLSVGDMAVGNSLDNNGHATGKANAFLNNSATVDVQGKLDINTGLFMNKDLYGTSVNGTSVNKYIVYERIDHADPAGNSIRMSGGTWDDHTGAARNCGDTTCPTDEQWAALYATPQTNGDATNASYTAIAGVWPKNDGTYVFPTTDGQVINHDIWRLFFSTYTTTSSGEISQDPANMYVGGSMTLNADTAVNDKSKIIVGGALNVTADNLQNIGGGGSTVTTHHDDMWFSQVVNGQRKLVNFEASDWTPVSNYWSSPGEVRYNTTPTNTGTLIGNLKEVNIRDSNNFDVNVTNASGIVTTPYVQSLHPIGGPNSVDQVVRSFNNYTVQLPTNSLYQIQAPNSPKGYLVETDPRFTQNKLWLGSDYMLKQMGYDPATQTQRLGDGFYEQKLIREQVAELTGRRFLNDYSNDEEQYKALMTAGALFAKEYNLIPGVALTAEQMALLTTDIVWLIEKEITLADGTKTKALVPQVYAVVKPGDIDGASGNLLSAKTINLNLKGDLINSGLIAARGNLNIAANNITNLAGTLQGMDVSLLATKDVQSIQANINAGKDLSIKAGQDILILAGNVNAAGNASLSAGRDLFLAAQERGSQLIEDKNKFNPDGSRIDTKNYSRSGTFDQTGGTMNIGGNLDMSAGNDFVAQGAQINAAGGVNITAGNDATITTAQKGSYYESVSTEKKTTWWGLGSRTTTITHTNTDLTNTAASINGGSVNINAGNDTTVIGANINGAGGVNIHGGNNTNILAAYDIKEKIDTKTVTSNDFGRFMDTLKQSATNPHITPIHTPTDTYSNNIDSTRKAVLTNINGGSGNVSLTAGNTLNLQAPVINGGSFTYGGGNQTNLLAAIDSREISNTSGGRNFHWQVNQSQGSKTETLHMTQVDVPVGMTNFVGAGGISVQLPKGSSLATQIDTLSKLPGNEYLVDLAKRSDIDWQQVDIINKTWDHKKEGLTQEAAIIVAIVVTIFTAGAASSAGVAAAEGAGFATATTAASTTVMATAGGTAFAAATAAAVTTLATQATIALINSQGDIGAALKEMASEQNLKVLATSVITAGLVQGLGSAINLPTGTGTSTTLIDKLQTNMVNGVASSLVSTAINGGSLEDNLKAALKNAVITSVAAQGAGMIGDANLDIFSSTLAHAILGCAIGTATTGQATGSGGGCAAGAGGAVVGELAANWYGANVAGATNEDIANFAKLATALVAAGGGAAAMNLAGMTSNNAVVNNYLSHTQWDELTKARQNCKEDTTCIKDVEATYIRLSQLQDNALAMCDVNKNCETLFKEAKEGEVRQIELVRTGALPDYFMGAGNLQSQGIKLTNDPAYRAQVSNAITADYICRTNPAQCTEQTAKIALGLTALVGGTAGAVVISTNAPTIAAAAGMTVKTCMENIVLCANQAGLAVSDFLLADATGGASIAAGVGATQATRLIVEEIKNNPIASRAYKEAFESTAELVIGRLPDTNAGAGLGMTRLNTNNWSLNVNDAWVQGGIDANKPFYLGSNISIGNLRSDDPRFPTTVFMRELKQLREAGYTRVGDYMMPPK